MVVSQKTPRRVSLPVCTPRNGELGTRVEAVGPKHFAVVAVDCAKNASRWRLADFYGRYLIPPTTLPHRARRFRRRDQGHPTGQSRPQDRRPHRRRRTHRTLSPDREEGARKRRLRGPRHRPAGHPSVPQARSRRNQDRRHRPRSDPRRRRSWPGTRPPGPPARVPTASGLGPAPSRPRREKRPGSAARSANTSTPPCLVTRNSLMISSVLRSACSFHATSPSTPSARPDPTSSPTPPEPPASVAIARPSTPSSPGPKSPPNPTIGPRSAGPSSST